MDFVCLAVRGVCYIRNVNLPEILFFGFLCSCLCTLKLSDCLPTFLYSLRYGVWGNGEWECGYERTGMGNERMGMWV